MGVRLHITGEGPSEERFVKDVLAPHLGACQVWADARSVLTSKDKWTNYEYRGGITSYRKAKRDIRNWMKEDRNPDARFTTMFDLYALPNDFPGFADAARAADPYDRVEALEKTLHDDIAGELGDHRFVPYIQLHEFEALILSDPQHLDWEFLEHDTPIRRLGDMVRAQGGNPELINDGVETAPSKRIIAEIPEYKGSKATAGPLVAGKIGMNTLLDRCRHFRQWVDKLSSLSEETSA